MKTNHHTRTKSIPILLMFLFIRTFSFSQGRVVINEYLPWPANSCGTTSEFVELLNFGPGPMNIGCYILTDGDYSITIPANTILQPGAFYVISGQSTINYPCGNIDSTIHPHLNWNTCNCTSAPIPTTGDGFMSDGGSASEQVVLLDPNLNVVDAVIRGLPAEPSSLITTSTVGGQCTSKTFDLDTMNIPYETIGESAGRGNSMARKLDGDCGWVKDTQESGNATNNTSGESSAVTYSFFFTKAQACPADGSIVVTVHASSYNDVFPMSYILAFDTDGDGIFETTDSYTYGTENDPSKIAIGDLVPGTYRLTVASVNGCYLHTFPFSILDCYIVLPVKLISFAVQHNNETIECRWTTEHTENLQRIVIERSTDGLLFSSFPVISVPPDIADRWSSGYSFPETNNTMSFFRLRLQLKNGQEIISSVVNISSKDISPPHIWPNPVTDRLLYVESYFAAPGQVEYKVYNISNLVVIKGEITAHTGSNIFSIPVQQLSRGLYQLILQNKNQSGPPVLLRFLKQ